MQVRAKDVTGRWGEAIAARYLSAAGFEILDRNWRCREGELDIVARDGTAVVFLEVKTRSTTAFGDPAEAVSFAKSRRIRRLAQLWLQAHVEERSREVRFDVVSVVARPQARTTLRHLRAAF